MSSLEVSLQTMGSVFSGYLVDKNSVPVMTKHGLNQLVKEQFPHCEKKEISPGVYEIRIPLAFSPTVEGNTLSCVELNVTILTKKLKQEKCDDATTKDFMDFLEGASRTSPNVIDLLIIVFTSSVRSLKPAMQKTTNAADRLKVEGKNSPMVPKGGLPELVNE